MSIRSGHWPLGASHTARMIDPRPSYPSLRFAVSPVRSPAPPASAAPASRAAHAPGLAAVAVRTRPLDLPRSEGLDLLDWLGLGRPEFGAIAARDLAPRCRRRLWNIERNEHPTLRARTAELLVVAELAGDGMVLFG